MNLRLDTKILKLWPNFIDHYRVIVRKLYDAQNHIGNSEHDLAFEILQEAQRLAPDYFEVARFMAYFYQKSGNYSDAIDQYELAIVLSPHSPQIYYWYGKFLLHSDEDLEGAVKHFEKAHTLDPKSIEVSLALARGYLFQHDFDKTQKLLCKLSENINSADDHLIKMFFDTEIQVLYRQADDLSKSGDLKEAMAYLDEMRLKFLSLKEHQKDKHIRQKLRKCNYVLSKIQRSEDECMKLRATQMQKWIDAEGSF